MEIAVEWLSDYTDCDQAGCSGGYSTGARVLKDGELWFELLPVATCFGGDSWDQDAVFAEIMQRLGHAISFEYGD